MGTLRWMAFVDGENFTIRGQALAVDQGVPLTPGRFFRQDSFLWRPGNAARRALTVDLMWAPAHELLQNASRAYYYTSAIGGTEVTDELRAVIHRVGFDPQVFKRDRTTKRSKAVDISLAVDMLHHAQLDHYDVAVLFAGDRDYLPLIKAVKRLGKLVWVAFFDDYTHREMKLVPDWYTSMERWLFDAWRKADAKAVT